MLSVVPISDEKKWDAIVRSFKNYDPHYLSGYAKAFQISCGGDPLLFYYDNGSTRAMNVVMKRDIAEAVYFKDKLPPNTVFDISTPYGYGGFWMEGKEHVAVDRAYDNYCREQGFVSEFVRFHLFRNSPPHYSGIIETHSHNVVRSLDLTMEEILREFKHKVRTNLKKASASGLNVEIDTGGKRLDDFLKVYYSTMDRRNAAKCFYFTREFFETISSLNENSVYFHILSEGRVISSELVLYGSENCYGFLGGTIRDFYHLRPNEFLKFEIIRWAKEKGIKSYILGGGFGEDDDLFRYKKSLAPNGLRDYYIGKKIYDDEKYAKLVAIRSEEAEFDASSRFFPKYRAEYVNCTHKVQRTN